MKKSYLSIILLSALILLWGCGKSGENEPADENKTETSEDSGEKTGIKGLDDFVDNMKEMEKNMKEGKAVEVVDFRELKALLPEEVEGMKRTKAEGEKNSAMGFNVSQAEGDYQTEDGSNSLDIQIVDMGNMSGLAGLATWGWTIAEIDKETETGYERTTKYQGHKAFEKYDNQYQNGNIDVLVEGRFMVSVNGNNVPMETIKSALDDIDLGKLAAMKDFGVTE
jgi:major membrane immunogen (membrane-anchored lipoprotein)